MDDMMVERVRIELAKIYMVNAIASCDMRFDVIKDISRRTFFRMMRWYPRDKGARLKMPMSWWQHFKEQYFPTWLQRLFPVKYNLYRAEAHFPHLDFLPKDFGAGYFEWMQMSEIDL